MTKSRFFRSEMDSCGSLMLRWVFNKMGILLFRYYLTVGVCTLRSQLSRRQSYNHIYTYPVKYVDFTKENKHIYMVEIILNQSNIPYSFDFLKR